MTERPSRLLSYALRHRPDQLGLELAVGGWVSVDVLLTALETEGHSVSPEDIARVGDTSDKKRFAISEDGTKIRANQGHSVEVDLGLQPITPPGKLMHGTVAKNLTGIRETGLVSRS